MPAVIQVIAGYARSYGVAISLALVLHILLLLALWLTRFSPPAKPVTVTAITSFLYQPIPAVKVEDIPPLPADEQTAAQLKPDVNSGEVSGSNVATEPAQKAVLPTVVKQAAAEQANAQRTAAEHAIQPQKQPQPGLAERTLNRAATPSSAVMQQAADASYQQFLQSQQQPKAKVHKRYQQLSRDPAGQVLAQLDDGKQLIRTKDGCRIADPAKDGFEGLMATRPVPCGDEVSRSALLQQALEKHSKH